MLDFRALRASGFTHPLMDDVEKRYTEAGWSADRISAEVPAAVTAARFDGDPPASLKLGRETSATPATEPREEPHASQTEEPHASDVLASASDSASGDKLLTAGRLEDALIVYKRSVEDCNRRLEAGQRMPGIVDERTKAFGRIREVALAWLAAGHASEAETAKDYLLRASGKTVLNQILYAHVLMLMGRDGEARATYYETASMRADENRDGRRATLDDFKVLSCRGVEHALIAEIETMLARRMLTR